VDFVKNMIILYLFRRRRVTSGGDGTTRPLPMDGGAGNST